MRTGIPACAMAVILGVTVPATVGVAGGAYEAPDAPYSVERSKLQAAWDCKGGREGLDGSGIGEPILLVHGTGVTRRQNFGWNYWTVLPAQGFEVCWVALPHGALQDAQVSAEYVAWAIKKIAAATDERVDVLGHSQGGLLPRWAIKWFASGRKVDDYVGLATPNHGTSAADAASAGGRCFESCWQMRRSARFIAALNRDEETPGAISYTSIYTQTDELVQPVGTQDLQGGSNISLQDLCPGRPVDHVAIVGDAVTFSLVLDALTATGPADPERAGYDCARGAMEGSDDPPEELTDMADWDQGKSTDKEPPLKPYAR